MSLIFLGDGAEEDLPEFNEFDDFDDLGLDDTENFNLMKSNSTPTPMMQAIGRMSMRISKTKKTKTNKVITKTEYSIEDRDKDPGITIRTNEDCEAPLQMMDGFLDDREENKEDNGDEDPDKRDSMNELDI